VAKLLRIAAAVHVVALAWLLVALPALGFVLGSRPTPRLDAQPRARPESRLEQHGAIWHCHLEGTALERGFACGWLTAPMMERHERELFTSLETLVPLFPLRHLVLGMVSFNNRGLESHLERDEMEAIAGLALGYRAAGDPHAHVGPAYSRILGYHALHDASQYLIDNPLVNAPQVGCSAVAVRGRHTAHGRLLVARLFDFEGGRSFDFDKVVYTVAPAVDEGGQRRLRYVHVAWGGIHGAVTGLNEAGLWLSVNAGVSDHFATQGRPLVVAVHRALETCTTIEEAAAHLTAHPVFVSESILIAGHSAAGGEPTAVCLELAPGRSFVREMQDDALVVTNHFAHPGWSGDGANQTRLRDGTTRARFERLTELLAATAQHTPSTLCEILRDRRGLGGRDIGFGHRSAINAWIGAHLAVADLEPGILYVAEPEHGLGRALAFDVRGPRDDVEPLLESPDAALFEAQGRTWKERLERARRCVAQRDARAAQLCRELIEANPRHHEPFALLAIVTDDAAAKTALLRNALEREPAYASERRAIEDALAELERAAGGR
jgi:hypothetical protein